MAGIVLGEERRSSADQLWVPVSRQEVRDWRKKLPEGWRRETDVARRRIEEQARSSDGETAELTVETPTKRREGRDTVSIMARDILEWAQENPDLFMQRVQYLKSVGQMSHLTDDQAVDQLKDLAEKLARDSAERVYGSKGWNSPVRLE